MRVTIKGMNKVQKNVKKVLLDTIVNKANRKEIGDKLLEKMIGSARSGKDPATNESFKPLKKKTKAFRKKWKENEGETGKLFKPNRSNLTLTGQLLESVKAIYETGKPTIEITPTGERDDGKKNAEIGKGHMEGIPSRNVPARRFLGVSDKMKEATTKTIKRQLRRSLTKFNRRK